MSKLIMVGVLVGTLLAGFGSAMAGLPLGCSNTPGAGHCPQGGVGDPLTLAASGVLIPFVTSNGTAALLEVASPVSANPDLHMNFFNSTCQQVGPSVGLPLTTNEVAFQQVQQPIGPLVPGIDGLIAISSVQPDGFTPAPLESPIHARMYLFSSVDGTSRVLEPIVLDTAEFAGNPHTWSPLRTGATFFSPLNTATLHTHLFLICPRQTIQGASHAYFQFPPFPEILPEFSPVTLPTSMRARVYDTDEHFLRNILFTCDCLTQKFLETTSPVDPTFLDLIYTNAVAAPLGTYTEAEVDPSTGFGTFTGYRAIFNVNNSLNNFFGRLSNGSRDSLQGTLSNER